MPGRSSARCSGEVSPGAADGGRGGAAGQATGVPVAPWGAGPSGGPATGRPAGGSGTDDRSNPHAPQKWSAGSSGSSQLGQAESWGIRDINHTIVRGRKRLARSTSSIRSSPRRASLASVR